MLKIECVNICCVSDDRNTVVDDSDFVWEPYTAEKKMMQGIVASNWMTPASNGSYGVMEGWKSDLKMVMGKTQLNSGVDRQGLRLLMPTLIKSRGRGWKVRAGWLFNGSEKGMNASSEHSESANEDILLFFFQLDLATRVQVLSLLLDCFIFFPFSFCQFWFFV